MSPYGVTGPQCVNKMNPWYFSLAATALKLQQISMFLHISARAWGHWWYPQTSEQWDLVLKPQTIFQWKCLCTYLESMLINFIQTSLYNISPIQAILCQFKRDVAAWMRLGCSKCMQRTWWQIVAMPYTGFRVFKMWSKKPNDHPNIGNNIIVTSKSDSLWNN